MTEDEIVETLRTMTAKEIAFVQGAAFQLLAMHSGVCEAELYADWARRAAADPDCHVVRKVPDCGDGAV